MKKMILIVAVAGFFASCSNSGDAAKQVKDSLDSVTKLKKESIDNSANKAKDTIEKANDSIKKRIDTSGKRIHDSLNKSK